jgi:hypothetical protein
MNFQPKKKLIVLILRHYQVWRRQGEAYLDDWLARRAP